MFGLFNWLKKETKRNGTKLAVIFSLDLRQSKK
jgi:hypothetical protein